MAGNHQALDLGSIESTLLDASFGVTRPSESLDPRSGWLLGGAG